MAEFDDKDPEFIWAVLHSQDRDFISYKFGSVMAGLSKGLRGAIIAPPDHDLFVADFNAIETRVLFWSAGEEEGLQMFRDGADIYSAFASEVVGYKVNRKLPEQEKEGKLGKEGILGLGFGMGAAKFVDRVRAQVGIEIPEDLVCEHEDEPGVPCGVMQKEHSTEADDDYEHDFVCANPGIVTATKVVNTYRSKYWRVKQMWKDQETAAIRAVRLGQEVTAGRFTWFTQELNGYDFLFCQLPSGRCLSYPEPAIKQKGVPWSDTETQPSLTFMGFDPVYHQWRRQSAYGGLLVENQTQAIARDVMADSFKRLLRGKKYRPVLTVHDEILAYVLTGLGNIKEFESIMAKTEAWAAGLPVRAEGWAGRRYKKA